MMFIFAAMLNKGKIGKNKVVGLLLLLTFLLLFINNVYFQHVHVLSDGTILLHAHPFNKTDGGTQQHKHSTAEFYTIANFGLYFNSEVITPDFKIYESVYFFRTTDLPIFSETNIYCSIGRSPPVQFFFL